MIQSAATQSESAQQQWFALVRGHLLEQLRTVFDACETGLQQADEQPVLCCELRRQRHTFIESYVNQLWLRCDKPDRAWVIGTAASAGYARTYIYMSAADAALHRLYQARSADFGRFAALWSQQTSLACTVLDCPLLPHTLSRLFFRLLPEIQAPMRVRHALASAFVAAIPRIAQSVQSALFNFLQRRGVLIGAVTPLSLPEWWEPLEPARTPSVTAQALVVPPRSIGKVAEVAAEVAVLALADDVAGVEQLLSLQRQSALMPWLATLVSETGSPLPPVARRVLCLLAAPLLHSACDESFADTAHPARRALDELLDWAPGWQECLGIEGIVPEYCCELARHMALVSSGGEGSVTSADKWLDLLDYLLQLRKRVQQDTSAVVASARLAIEAAEVRAEVENLLHERAGLERWPQVVIDILGDTWTALLMGIHWRESTASDAWLNAIAVADELLASARPGIERQLRQRLIQRVPQLLQGLRNGFDEIGFDRRAYSVLLERLEKVHLALLQGCDESGLPDTSCFWPEAAALPASDEPFDVGSWLQQSDGSVWIVQFSDRLCTVLLDAHSAALDCCSTAALQAEYYDGNLVTLPSPPPLLPARAG